MCLWVFPQCGFEFSQRNEWWCDVFRCTWIKPARGECGGTCTPSGGRMEHTCRIDWSLNNANVDTLSFLNSPKITKKSIKSQNVHLVIKIHTPELNSSKLRDLNFHTKFEKSCNALSKFWGRFHIATVAIEFCGIFDIFLEWFSCRNDRNRKNELANGHILCEKKYKTLEWRGSYTFLEKIRHKTGP